jgi:curli production assembly/transport component CsgE
MKWLLLLVLCYVVCLRVQAQTDAADTLREVKEAPESLKMLFESIKQEETNKVKRDADIEIDGLLFDDTKTKSGREFYDFFYRDWQAPAEARNYSIIISERPFRLNITLIEVMINETVVFQSFLQPRTEVIESLAGQSIASTQMYLQRYEEIVRELDGDDRSGTGIY